MGVLVGGGGGGVEVGVVLVAEVAVAVNVIVVSVVFLLHIFEVVVARPVFLKRTCISWVVRIEIAANYFASVSMAGRARHNATTMVRNGTLRLKRLTLATTLLSSK